jgi:hypothetical protein
LADRLLRLKDPRGKPVADSSIVTGNTRILCSRRMSQTSGEKCDVLLVPGPRISGLAFAADSSARILLVMPQQLQLEYFVVRYQPNLVHEKFVNIGLVMVALGNADFGDVRFLKNWTPVLRLDPNADTEVLTEFATDVGEQIRNREKREQMLQQMKESFSNIIQLSASRVCVSEDPTSELEKLSAQYLPD